MPTSLIRDMSMPVNVMPTNVEPAVNIGGNQEMIVKVGAWREFAPPPGIKRLSLLHCLKSVLMVSRVLGFFPFRFEEHGDGRMDVRFSGLWLIYNAVLYTVLHAYGFIVYFTSNISLSKTSRYSFGEAVEKLVNTGTIVDVSLFMVSFFPTLMSTMLATVTVFNWPQLGRLMRRFGELPVLPSTAVAIQKNTRFFRDFVVLATLLAGFTATVLISVMLGDNLGAMWPYACAYWYCMAGDSLFVAIVTCIARAFRVTVNEHLSLGLNSELKGLDKFRKRYGELCNMVEATAKCFSAWILVTSASLLVLLTCSIHFCIWIGQRESKDGLLVQIAPVMIHFLRMAVLCWTASRPEEEAMRTTGVLAQIEGEILEDIARPKVIHFNVEISNSTKSLSAAGFFRVNAALILSVLGNVASYLVIFLQFSDFNPAGILSKSNNNAGKKLSTISNCIHY